MEYKSEARRKRVKKYFEWVRMAENGQPPKKKSKRELLKEAQDAKKFFLNFPNDNRNGVRMMFDDVRHFDHAIDQFGIDSVIDVLKGMAGGDYIVVWTSAYYRVCTTTDNKTLCLNCIGELETDVEKKEYGHHITVKSHFINDWNIGTIYDMVFCDACKTGLFRFISTNLTLERSGYEVSP